MRQTGFALTSLLVISLACASANVGDPTRLVDLNDVPTPTQFLVYDFGITPEDGAFDAKQQELAEKVVDTFSTRLVQKLDESGIEAVRATPSSETPLNALLLTGDFVTVSKGSFIKRTVIGFGAGASKLSVAGDVYQVTETGRRKISMNTAEAQGNKKPGAIVAVAGGVATGGILIPAAIATTATGISEVRSGPEKDAENLADAVAERVVEVYKEQGWL